MKNFISSNMKHMMTGFFLGLPVGGVLILGILGIVHQPAENPRIMKFGDITIYANVPADANDSYAEELIMEKNNKPFLYAPRNSMGQVTELGLSDGLKGIIFTLRGSPQNQYEWFLASYGPFENMGEHYIDMNFDGYFDIKTTYNNKGEINNRYIYFNQSWIKIDGFQEKKSISGSKTFIFNNTSGWQIDKP